MVEPLLRMRTMHDQDLFSHFMVYCTITLTLGHYEVSFFWGLIREVPLYLGLIMILHFPLQPRNVTESVHRVSRLLSRERRKRRKIEALGIDYEFPGYSSQVACGKNSKASSHTLFVDSDSD